MRIWSLHPSCLDAKGIVALWRETLLAKHVLEGKTKGYLHHPQLLRFKEHPQPIGALHEYLKHVFLEAQRRGYHFNPDKFDVTEGVEKLKVTRGQVEYETQHLLHKLKLRDIKRYKDLKQMLPLPIHPLMKLVNGNVADWEIQ